MLVEIRGVDYEKMGKIEHILVSKLDLGFRKADGFDKKVCINADTGEATPQNTHRDVYEIKGTRVYLREPGELCITIEGSKQMVLFLLGAFDMFPTRQCIMELYVA